MLGRKFNLKNARTNSLVSTSIGDTLSIPNSANNNYEEVKGYKYEEVKGKEDPHSGIHLKWHFGLKI